MTKMMHKGLENGPLYDNVSIETNYRWKESELSGDEWRASACVTWYYKGFVVMKATFTNSETALRLADGYFNLNSFDKYNMPDILEFCDQPGCQNKASYWFQIIQEYSTDGTPKNSPLKRFRKFCDKHKTRGDCSLEDSDTNYLQIAQEATK